MAQAHLELADLASFLAAIKAARVRGVVVRTVREIRPRQLENHKVEVAAQAWVELSAYVKGQLFVAKLHGADGEAIAADLEAQGYKVSKLSGNIT